MSSKLRITSSYKGRQFNNQYIQEPPVERFAFNLSFITPDKKYNLSKLDKNILSKLVKKIHYLSQKDMIDLISHDSKEDGLEKIPERSLNNLTIDPLFKATRFKACEDDYWVFRLNKMGRVIGKKYKNIFYIMSIDTKFKQYKH